jgi:mannan endo-1,6-alpha-mannosidase
MASCTRSDGSCTCTPSITKTVYVVPSSQVVPPVVPVLSTAVVPGVSVNSSIPRPSPSSSQPLEFQGAAVNIKVTSVSILGAAFVAMVVELL